MTIARVENHAAIGVAHLIERYRRPRISALLTSWLDEVQDIEDALHAMLTGIITQQLDVVGRIVGQPREGRNDEVYAMWIRARIRANRSTGTTADILGIATALGVPSPRLIEHYPAAFVLRADALYAWQTGVQAAKLLAAAKGAGIAGWLHWWGAAPFRFSASATPEPGSPHGFGNGQWSSISGGEDLALAEGEGPDFEDEVTVSGAVVTVAGEPVWVPHA